MDIIRDGIGITKYCISQLYVLQSNTFKVKIF
jgi:hypothetical protein